MTKNNIPNLLTIIRGVMTLIIIGMFMVDFSGKYLVLLLLFLLAAGTDFMDGYLARRWQVQSVFGKVFDSMLDKILILAVMMMLIPYQLLPTPVWVLFLIRELAVDSLKSYLASQNMPLSPLWTGKLKMAAEVGLIAICLLRLNGDNNGLRIASEITAAVGLGLAYYSAAIYFRNFRRG